MEGWTEVCAADEITAGNFRMVKLGRVTVLVFRLEDGYYAIEDRCTHEEFELNDGEVFDGTITCSLHGACFSIKTGEVLEPPAYESLTTFPVKVENDRVWVRNTQND